MSRFDVLIVGAGPAGAWTAYRLARVGASVALVDGSHPREKPCGGGVTGRALALLRPALDPRALASVQIADATFTHSGRTAQIQLSLDASGYPPLVVAGRREFDGALLSAAIAAGAEHKPFRVTEIQREDNGWTVATREDRYMARWLVGADGANSLVRRHVLRPFGRADLSLATGFFVRGRSSREILVSFEEDPPGYLWSFPRPDHLAVGVCAQADEGSSRGRRERVHRWLEDHVGAGASLDRYSWPIPSLDEISLAREQPAGRRWMLVGDAAGLVDPITREGIYFALRSADFAADALTGNGDPGAAFADRVRTDIHSELIRAARLKARFFRPRFIGLLMAALNRSDRVRGVMADLVAGHQTYRGLRRRLLKTLEVRLMLELFG